MTKVPESGDQWLGDQEQTFGEWKSTMFASGTMLITWSSLPHTSTMALATFLAATLCSAWLSRV
jgi:hypothetical protein